MIWFCLTGGLAHWAAPFVLLSFCFAIAAIVSFLFGRERVCACLLPIGTVFLLGLLDGLFPALEWPLRAVGSRPTAELLTALHQPVQRRLIAGKPAELILEVPSQAFVVATECNGFGLLTSAVLVATVWRFSNGCRG